MRKICFQIHKWLSIPFGIILAIVCLTGAILALEPELSELFYRSRYYVKEVQATPLPTEQLLEAAREQLPPSLEATGIQESDDPQRTYQVTLKGKRKAAFIDPYTAKVVAIDDGTGFFMKTMRFHRWLYDTYKRGAFSWGKTIVGYSTLAMVIILITEDMKLAVLCIITGHNTKGSQSHRLRTSIFHCYLHALIQGRTHAGKQCLQCRIPAQQSLLCLLFPLLDLRVGQLASLILC